MAISPKELETRGGVDRAAVFFATCGYSSLLPLAILRRLPWKLSTDKWSGCGLMGSFCGVATYLLLPLSWARSPWALVGGTLVSVVISGRAEVAMGRHDDSRIVIDEWIGAWIAAVAAPHALGWPLAASFVLFRVFDVLKGPFGPLQRLPGGWGVTMDDVGAGLAAAAVVHFLPFAR